MRRYRGLFRPLGAFTRAQFSADYTISMFGFNLRLEQPEIGCPPPSNMSERLTAKRAPFGQNDVASDMRIAFVWLVVCELGNGAARRHAPATARTASLIFARAKCPTASKSTCGRLGISSAALRNAEFAQGHREYLTKIKFPSYGAPCRVIHPFLVTPSGP
jgi:hypothetical protein